ncbi:NFACT-R_1 domain-containing protein, partial [Haematococcus lacustris]
VLVGRNNRQNDELSNKVANPDDLWMHLRGRPGSHTVLRVPSGRRAPDLHGDPDTQFAADLAAFFSKGRNETKVDILVAKAGALKKPKGAKPGQILVTKELGNVVARPGNSVAAQSGAAE